MANPNVDGLVAYIDEQKLPLIRKSILGDKTFDIVNIQPGVKSSAMINYFDTDLVGQSNSTCGFNAEGGIILLQEEISVCPIKIDESFCVTDLESYWTQKLLKPGSYNEEIPFEGLYAEDHAVRVADLAAKLFWAGSVTGGTGNMALCDGLIEKAQTVYADRVIDGNTLNVTAVTASNIVNVVDAMVATTATDILDADDVHLFVGYDFYRMYAKSLRDANLFHFTGDENQNGAKYEMFVPGTNVRMVAIKALNGTSKMFLGSAMDFVLGTDLTSDWEQFYAEFSRLSDAVLITIRWKQGAALRFPERVSYFELV